MTDPPIRRKRPIESHKGSFGSVLVIAGSHRYFGAARLCAESARRAGAGYVILATPAGHPLGLGDPTVILEALPATKDGQVSVVAHRTLKALAARATSLVIGPGLGRPPLLRALLSRLICEAEKPFVLDADGLNAFENAMDELAPAMAPGILTPHGSEAARLQNVSVKDVLDDPVASAAAISLASEKTVLLKGHPTVLCGPQGHETHHRPNDLLAQGGSGDVLAGVLGALLAQGFQPMEAGALALWAQAEAADQLRALHGPLEPGPDAVSVEIGRVLARALG